MSINVSVLAVVAPSDVCLSTLLSETFRKSEHSMLTRRVCADVADLARRLFRLFNLECESVNLELSRHVRRD